MFETDDLEDIMLSYEELLGEDEDPNADAREFQGETRFHMAAEHMLQERACREQAQKVRTLKRTIEEFSSLMDDAEEDDRVRIATVVETMRDELAEATEDLEPQYLGFTEHVNGEFDDLSTIGSSNWVDWEREYDEESGTWHTTPNHAVSGHEYASQAQGGYWVMGPYHVDAMCTRMENGEPYKWSERQDSTSRMRHDDEGDDGDCSRFRVRMPNTGCWPKETVTTLGRPAVYEMQKTRVPKRVCVRTLFDLAGASRQKKQASPWYKCPGAMQLLQAFEIFIKAWPQNRHRQWGWSPDWLGAAKALEPIYQGTTWVIKRVEVTPRVETVTSERITGDYVPVDHWTIAARLPDDFNAIVSTHECLVPVSMRKGSAKCTRHKYHLGRRVTTIDVPRFCWFTYYFGHKHGNWNNGEPCMQQIPIADETGTAELGEFMTLMRRTPPHQLATYYRKPPRRYADSGVFHENIRVVVRPDGALLDVGPDFKPEEVWEDYDRKVYEPIEELVEVERNGWPSQEWLPMLRTRATPIYVVWDNTRVQHYAMETRKGKQRIIRDKGRLVKAGTTPMKRRFVWHKNHYLRFLWELSQGILDSHLSEMHDLSMYLDEEGNLKDKYLARMHELWEEMDDLNQRRVTKQVYREKQAVDEYGESVTDEEGNPIPEVTVHRRLKSGGLSFRGSSQLAPDPGCAYSSSARYSFTYTPGTGSKKPRNFWAKSLADRFRNMVSNGEVKTCTCVEQRGDETVTKRQVYAVMPLTRRAGGKTIHVCVFSDLAPFKNS